MLRPEPLFGPTGQAASRLPRVPGYEILAKVAEGGMGAVLRARDPALGRELAVKVVKASVLARPDKVEMLRRFVEEAKIGGQLQHPGIVPVHALGQMPDGLPYFTMKLVQGRTLADLLKERPTPQHDLPRFLKLFEQVAQALAYAHSRGVIHRDLKPLNVMVGQFGELQVMDWGLAKVLGTAEDSLLQVSAQRMAEGGETEAGRAFGTPAYMPPEQAKGEIATLDERCDVFALGAMLCEILTGRPPYVGRDIGSKVLAGDLADAFARLTNCGAEAELLQLTQTCLAREVKGRPADALVVADAMTAYLAGVQDRLKQAEIERAAAAAKAAADLRARRVRTVALVLTLVVVLLGVGGGAALWQWREAEGARGLAEAARQEAVQARDALNVANDQLGRLRYAEQVSLAQSHWREGKYKAAFQLLDACPAKYRGFEWDYLHTAFNRGSDLHGHTQEVTSIAFTPEGTRLVSGSKDRTVRWWDVRTGDQVAIQDDQAAPIDQMAFSPDGARLVTSSDNGTVFLRDGRTGVVLARLTAHKDQLLQLLFSPDGSRLVTRGKDGTVRLWHGRNGEVVDVLQGHTAAVNQVVFSPDSTLLATCNSDETIRLWDARTAKALFRPLTGHNGDVNQVVFSADSSRLVSRGADDTLRLWNARTGQALTAPLIGHTALIFNVAFSPDGTRLASCGMDHTVRLWDGLTGKLLAKHGDHGDLVYQVVFSPDGTRMASSSRDGAVRLWDGRTGQAAAKPLLGHTGPVTPIFSPDGGRLASLGLDATARIWDVLTGDELAILAGHPDEVHHLAFSPDGTQLATCGKGSVIRLWDGLTGKILTNLEGHAFGVTQVAFSPDGSRIASGSLDNTVRLWDSLTGRLLAPPWADHRTPISALAFSPDGTLLVSASHNGTVLVRESLTGRPLHSLDGHTEAVHRFAFSPDGTRLASGGFGDPVRLWDTRTGKALFALDKHPEQIYHVTFSPDGTRLASGGKEGTIRLWDSRTGKDGPPLTAHTGTVFDVAFSPDGRLLASCGEDKTVRLWDAQAGKLLGTLLGHTEPVHQVLFSPHDGTLLVSRSHDMTMRLWNVATRTMLAVLEGHTAGVRSVVFSPDGRRLASSSDDGTVRLWDALTGKALVTLEGHTDGVYQVAFSPDGTRLASCSHDKTVRLWLGTQKLLDRERRRQDWHAHQAAWCEAMLQWHGAAFHLDYLLRRSPDGSALHLRRGSALAELGRWSEALLAHARAVELSPRDGQANYYLGLVHLARGSEADYRQICRQMLREFADAKDSDAVAFTAWLGILRPGSVEDLKLLMRMTELAVQANAFHPGTLGTMHYRAGNYQAAQDDLVNAAKAADKMGLAIEGQLFLAMSHQQLGQVDQAKEQLAKTIRHIDKTATTPWHRLAAWRLLRQEAETLILGKESRLQP